MGYGDTTAAAVFNESGDQLAVADARGCWLYRNAEPGNRFPTARPIGNHRKRGTGVGFSRGKVISASEDGTVAWSNDRGELEKVLCCFADSNPYHSWAHDQRVLHVDVSISGRWLLTVEFDVGSDRGRVRVWDVDQLDKPQRTTEETTLSSSIIATAWFDPSDESRILLVQSPDMFMWQASGGVSNLTGGNLTDTRLAAFSNDGQRITKVGRRPGSGDDGDDDIEMFDVAYHSAGPHLTLVPRSSQYKHEGLGIVTALQGHPSDRDRVMVASNNENGTGAFRIWHGRNGVIGAYLLKWTEQFPTSVHYATALKSYVVGTEGTVVVILDAQLSEKGAIGPASSSSRADQPNEAMLWRFQIQSQRDGPVYYYSMNPCVPPAFTNRTPAFKVFAPIEDASDAYVPVYLMNRNIADSYSTQVYRYASSPTPPAGFKVSDIASKEQGKPAPLFLLYAKPSGNARLPVYQYERATSDPNTKKYCLARGNDQPPDSGYVKMGTEPLGWVPT